MKRLVLLLILLLMMPPLAGQEARSKAWDALVTTTDGFKIRASYLQPDVQGERVDADAVILVHDLGGTRADWGTLPEKLSKAGYAVLSLQLRGHDDREKSSHHWTRFEREEFNAMALDILGGRRWLQAQKKVHIRKIAVIGARFGANLGLRALKEDGEMKACYTLSPGLNYRGVKVPGSLEGLAGRKVKCVAATEDSYSVKSCEAFAEGGAEVRVLEADDDDLDDGTALLTSHPELQDDILQWLKSAL